MHTPDALHVPATSHDVRSAVMLHAAFALAACAWHVPDTHAPLWQSSLKDEQSFALLTHTPPVHVSVVHGLLSVHAAALLSLCLQPAVLSHVSVVHGFLSSQFVAGCVHAPVDELQTSSVQALPSEQSFAEST